MALRVEIAGQPADTRDTERPVVLRIPRWVLDDMGKLDAQFCGQVTMNFYLGGVTTVEYRVTKKAPKV